MKYYIAIEPKDANNEDYGAMLLDFDGCTAQSETLDKLLIDIAEAGEEWAKVANENNIDIPQPSDIETLKTKYPNLDDFVLGVVDLDLSKLTDKVEHASWFDIVLYEEKGNVVDFVLDNGEETIKFSIKKTLKEATTDRYSFETKENESIAFDHDKVILSGIEVRDSDGNPLFEI